MFRLGKKPKILGDTTMGEQMNENGPVPIWEDSRYETYHQEITKVMNSSAMLDSIGDKVHVFLNFYSRDPP